MQKRFLLRLSCVSGFQSQGPGTLVFTAVLLGKTVVGHKLVAQGRETARVAVQKLQLQLADRGLFVTGK